MKLLDFTLFVVCDVVFRLMLNRCFFRSLANKWRLLCALCYWVFMGGFYLEVMGGEGLFGFSRVPLNLVEVWFVIVMCGAMIGFHFWALSSRLRN